MVLIDERGRPVQGATVESPVLEDETTGYTVWDTTLVANDLERGDYHLLVRTGLLEPSLYPRGESYVDDDPYVVFFVESTPAFDPEFDLAPERDRECALEPRATAYFSPEGPPRVRPAPAQPQAGCDGKAGAGLLLVGLLPWAWRRRPPGRRLSSG